MRKHRANREPIAVRHRSGKMVGSRDTIRRFREVHRRWIEMIAPKRQFALCVENTGYEASLIVRKIYEVLPDQEAAQDDLLRVVDESGEDDLYHRSLFILVEFPAETKHALSAVGQWQAQPAPGTTENLLISWRWNSRHMLPVFPRRHNRLCGMMVEET